MIATISLVNLYHLTNVFLSRELLRTISPYNFHIYNSIFNYSHPMYITAPELNL